MTLPAETPAQSPAPIPAETVAQEPDQKQSKTADVIEAATSVLDLGSAVVQVIGSACEGLTS